MPRRWAAALGWVFMAAACALGVWGRWTPAEPGWEVLAGVELAAVGWYLTFRLQPVLDARRAVVVARRRHLTVTDARAAYRARKDTR